MPASFDLFGTCFSEKARPPTLKYQHIQRYVSSVAALATGSEPLQSLHDSTNEKKTVLSTITGVSNVAHHGDAECLFNQPSATFNSTTWNQEEALKLSSQASADKEAVTDYGTTSANKSWEDLFPGKWQQDAVYIDVDKVDFGSCSRLVAGEYKTVTVKNSFHKKITAFISIPLWEDPSGVDSPQKILEVRKFGY